MDYRFYDVLTHLVPGFLLYFAAIYFSELNIDTIPVLPATAIAFAFGYINNSISSWIEPVIYLTWGGKPSSELLKGNGTLKVKFHEAEEAMEKIKSEKGSSGSKDEMFSFAYRKALANEKKSRILDFNASYAFSRSIFLAILILMTLYFFHGELNVTSVILAILILIAFWYRSKERAYYFSREVLNTYLSR